MMSPRPEELVRTRGNAPRRLRLRTCRRGTTAILVVGCLLARAVAASSALELASGPLSPPPLPPDTTAFNLALAANGGHIDHLTGVYGPGYYGRLLHDGIVEPPWEAEAPVGFPQEIVISFYERNTALVAAVAIDSPADPASAPRNVEVLIQPPDANDDGVFTPVAARELTGEPHEQVIAFPAEEARRVKLRITSAASADRLAIGEVRVFEGKGTGYVPLRERYPDLASWQGSPREAGQRGLDWLQQAAIDWDRQNRCYGCHVQSQALMGQSIALGNGYAVDREALAYLENITREYQVTEDPDAGSWRHTSSTAATQFALMSLAYAGQHREMDRDRQLLRGLDWLLQHQSSDGGFPNESSPPIIQGPFMPAANAIVALMRAYELTHDEKYRQAAARALSWIAANQPVTTQDAVFALLALTRFGSPEQRRFVHRLRDRLLAEQQSDGGWSEAPQGPGSNAFATGQVLYALKQTGASVDSQVFRRGVGYLLETQIRGTQADGSWHATNTQGAMVSNFAPTMWAVIGLAGSYHTRATGSLEVHLTTAPPLRSSGSNLEIVLDCSASMRQPLGGKSRWQVALEVFEQVVNTLPDAMHVGLRVYGHRFGFREAQACTDTQLLVPIAPLDRPRLLDAVRRLQTRGETPLVHAVLQTPDDLRPVGGGSVVLITDGEESCRGSLPAAIEHLRTAGVDLTLNIVGFTLNTRTANEQLGALAAATGGQYVSAQSGAALARAVTLATLRSLPFEVFDRTGHLVAAGETSPLGLELPPGDYRVVVKAPEQELAATVTIAARANTVLNVSRQGEGFVLEQPHFP
jgi:hypothetical protein